MNNPNLKSISKSSSSSSGSLKFIPDYVMESRILQKFNNKDLFDELLDEKSSWENSG
jgi:hypothetical protein